MTQFEKDIANEIKVKESKIRSMKGRPMQNSRALLLEAMQIQQLRNAQNCIKDAMSV